MLEDSTDILNISIAIAVLALAGLSSWAIYYVAMMLRQSFKMVKEMRDRMHKIDDLVKSMKEKIEHSTSYLLLIGEGVKKLVEIIDKRTDKKAKDEE